MGNTELSRLWNLSTDDSYLTNLNRIYLPNLKDYLKPLELEINNPKSDIEEEFKLKNNKVYNWKGLRLVAKQKLHLFSRITTGIMKIKKINYFDFR